MNTNLEKNFSKLLETLKDCLQPKDQKPDNRPDCRQLLKKIKQFSFDKSFLKDVSENKNIYEGFKLFLEKQDNIFIKRFFYHKIDEKIPVQQTSESNDNLKSLLDPVALDSVVEEITRNTNSGDKLQLMLTLVDLLKIIIESREICRLYLFKNGIDVLINILKVCLFF